MEPPSGLILLKKTEGVTSFQALAPLKKILDTRRVGHLGTLDRFAGGLLPVLVGSSTRLAFLFEGADKAYRAVFFFGRSTDTLDPEGQVVAEAPVPSLQSIERALECFRGPIQQTPPDYSAVHVAGKRAYQLARAGRKPELRPRNVTIHRIVVLRYNPPELELSIDCSKGTYVRALARDLGRQAGSCAYVSRLSRVRVGAFRLEEAVAPQDFEASAHLLPPAQFLPRLGGIGLLALDSHRRGEVLNGRPLSDDCFLTPARQDGNYAVLDGDGRLLAVIRRREGRHEYQAVFPEAAG
jgi:tRNA pseudouridine55 synthase